MKKYALLLLLFFSSILSASVIPQYQIASIDNNVITFSNNSTFVMAYSDFIYFPLWQPGNLIEIVYRDSQPLSKSPQVVGDMIVANPFLILRNFSRSDEEVAAILDTPPPDISADTFAIIFIDHLSHIITLNDATQWRYAIRDEMLIQAWDVGDLIMIGRDDNESFRLTDACLLNTNRYQILIARQL